MKIYLDVMGGDHAPTATVAGAREALERFAQLQLELAFASRGYGSSIYAGWHVVDEHPRDSKEGMLEFGASFYY